MMPLRHVSDYRLVRPINDTPPKLYPYLNWKRIPFDISIPDGWELVTKTPWNKSVYINGMLDPMFWSLPRILE